MRNGSALLQGIGKKALIVSGAHGASASGALEDCLEVLEGLGIGYCHYPGIRENPELESIIYGKTVMLGEGCDCVIGIGGGSPMDAAKAISIAAANGLKREDLYRVELFKQAYPIVAIPTTAGTGSELTQYSVLTDSECGRKAGWGHELAFPKVAFIDPRYTISMGREVTINTGLDALSHLLEGLYSTKREALIYPLIHTGMGDILQHLPLAAAEPTNMTARAALARASLYGGISIAQAGTTLQHSIGYPLTSTFGIPHGLANGIVMQQIMELYYPHVGTVLDETFSAIGSSRKSFYAWLEKILPPVKMDMDAAFTAKSVPEVMASRNMANNPLTVAPEQVGNIYETLRRQA
jgi:alcohol dehydrogenase